MRIKICGLTKGKDVQAAIHAGADALGFVFYDKSKRYVSIAQARNLLGLMAPFVQAVGLFVNPSADFVHAVLSQVPLDMLQFHGDESPDFCASFHRRWIKAVPMKDLTPEMATAYLQDYQQAEGFLFDAFGKTQMGGSGETFDWQRLPMTDKPIILAGGLDVNNVAAAIRLVKPWAVDVSSGVETAPGIKSSAKMRSFIETAKSAVL